jgi:hypothetical protein
MHTDTINETEKVTTNGVVWAFYTHRYRYPVALLVEALGLIPHFLDPWQAGTAIEQMDAAYCGSWLPIHGVTLGRGQRPSVLRRSADDAHRADDL